MSEECEPLLDDRAIRQGDVFQWLGDAERSPWALYGVVVTADCDLAKEKTRGVLSYVPILTDEAYFWTFWRPDKFAPILQQHAAKAAGRITNQLQKSNPNQKPMSADSLLAWLDRRGVAGVVSDIGLTDNGQIKELSNRLNDLQLLVDLLSKEDPDYAALKSALPLKNPKASSENYDSLREELRSVVTSLPGDTFFFSHLPGGSASGYFAMLRYISQCPITDVAINQEQLKFGGAKSKRVAKMTSPYLYAMTQGLARVFTDIGLPRTYENMRAENPARLTAALESRI